MESLELGIGDTIQVYKANMIIPQIADNLSKTGGIQIPTECPVCHEPTKLHKENDVKSLYCINPDCLAKRIKSFTHFVGRDAMNVDGLSEATIEKFIAKGFIKELADLFHLKAYREEIVIMEGFGEKSYSNLIDSIEKARTTIPAKFLYSLGIQNIGLSNAKLICREFNNDFDKVRHADREQLLMIPGIGDVIADTFVVFFSEEKNNQWVDDVLKEIMFEEVIVTATPGQELVSGKTFVITGSLEQFTNRNELKEALENQGGKVTGSVTAKTDYLINNDNLSASSKNKKAKELGIPVITEIQVMDLLKGIAIIE